MTNDPHAENRRLYEQDVLETDKPWERWELSYPDCEYWRPIRSEPSWIPELLYRRKTTLTINGREVPMPLYARPERGMLVCYPSLQNPDTPFYRSVNDITEDEWHLGIYHLTADAAIKHAKAILSFTERKKP